MTEPIEMPFETWTRVDPRKGILFNIILSGDQDPHGERGNFFGGGIFRLIVKFIRPVGRK